MLIAVPHAGRAYPPDVLAALRDPAGAAARLEDRLADQLGEAVAAQTGATLLVADAPRAMIDLNRAPDDIDPGMFAGDVAGIRAGTRARAGLGLIPRRSPGLGELWRHPLPVSVIAERIEGIHRPYHTCLAETLASLRARWGAALLIDLHSMPPLPARAFGFPLVYGAARAGGQGAQVVLGDRFGASCHGALIASAFACIAEAGWRGAHNRPYAGGYGLERHAAPRRAIHAMQIEIDRSRYLDAPLMEPGEGFAETVALVVGLVTRLADEVAVLGAGPVEQGWGQAAE